MAVITTYLTNALIAVSENEHKVNQFITKVDVVTSPGLFELTRDEFQVATTINWLDRFKGVKRDDIYKYFRVMYG